MAHAKAVLLVDDDKAQSGEGHVLAVEGVGPDDRVAEPHLEFSENLLAFGTTSGPNQKLHPEPGRFEEGF